MMESKMKRSSKNWLMGVGLAVVTILTGVTIYFAGRSLAGGTGDPSGMNGQMGGGMGQMGGGTPPEMPSGGAGGTPPEMPSGETNEQSEPPAKPEGDSSGMPEMPSGNNGGTPPDMPSGNRMTMPGNGQMTGVTSSLGVGFYVLFVLEGLIISGLAMYLIMSQGNKLSFKEAFKTGDKIAIMALAVIILTAGVTFGAKCIAEASAGSPAEMTMPGGEMNGGQANISYNAATEITESTTITSGNYASTGAYENAISVSGEISASFTSIDVTKTGDSDGGDNTSFYGINSAIIARGGANLTLKNITVETDATGANGVFAYGGSATTNNTGSDGTTITISDSKITTKKDASGGIMATGGGILNASNLTVETAGVSSAAIRTDRGGGTVTVDGGTYTTTGQGSPSIYSTADVTVRNADLVAKVSEGVVIEGKNSVTLENVTLTDSNTKLNGLSTTYKNIFLYQSVSGDAAEGTSTFSAKNSDITTAKGDTFYITNTSAVINLTGNTIKNSDATGNFLRAQQDSWGKSGANGGEVALNLTSQDVTGNIVIDEVSTLEMKMEASSFEGTLNGENTAKNISLVLDASSKIKLTRDSYVTSLEDDDSSYGNIDFNGYKLYVNGKAIN